MRLILHIGMHKTASTTIQRRLKANNPKLQDFGFRYAAKERKTLLKAVRKKNFKPWRKLIRQAQTEGFTPIVSMRRSRTLCVDHGLPKTTAASVIGY